MKLVLPGVENVFDFEDGAYVWELIVENQPLMYRILSDLSGQLEGNDGQAVLSEDFTPVSIAKRMELLWRLVPFDINSRPLVNKAAGALGHLAVSDVYYEKTTGLMAELEAHLLDMSFALDGNFEFANVNISAIIKAVGVTFASDGGSLGERLADYFELVHAYDNRKLFVLLSLRSYMDDGECERFISTVVSRGYQVLLLESSQRKHLKGEKQIIIDRDLCEIL